MSESSRDVAMSLLLARRRHTITMTGDLRAVSRRASLLATAAAVGSPMLLSQRCQSATGPLRQLLLASATSKCRSTGSGGRTMPESPSSLEMNVTAQHGRSSVNTSVCTRFSSPPPPPFHGTRSFSSSIGSLASAAMVATTTAGDDEDDNDQGDEYAHHEAPNTHQRHEDDNDDVDDEAILVEANRTLIQLCQGNMLLNEMLEQQQQQQQQSNTVVHNSAGNNPHDDAQSPLSRSHSVAMEEETNGNENDNTLRRTDHQALRFLNAMISKSMQHAQTDTIRDK